MKRRFGSAGLLVGEEADVLRAAKGRKRRRGVKVGRNEKQTCERALLVGEEAVVLSAGGGVGPRQNRG